MLGDDVGGIVDLLVDELAVADVDKWDKVGRGDAEERETPIRSDLD